MAISAASACVQRRARDRQRRLRAGLRAGVRARARALPHALHDPLGAGGGRGARGARRERRGRVAGASEPDRASAAPTCGPPRTATVAMARPAARAPRALFTAWAAMGWAASGRRPSFAGRYLARTAPRMRAVGDVERTILATRRGRRSPRRAGGADLVHRLGVAQRRDGSWGGQVNLTSFGIVALLRGRRGGEAARPRRALGARPAESRRRLLVRPPRRDLGDRRHGRRASGARRRRRASGSRAVRRAVAFLGRQQHLDGGFPLTPGGSSNAPVGARGPPQAFAPRGAIPAASPGGARARRSATSRASSAPTASVRYVADEPPDAGRGSPPRRSRRWRGGRSAHPGRPDPLGCAARWYVSEFPRRRPPASAGWRSSRTSCAGSPAATSRSWSSPGRGTRRCIPDRLFEEAGAALGDPWGADVVVKIAPPSPTRSQRLGSGSVLIGFLAPLSAAGDDDRARGDRARRRSRWRRSRASAARRRWTP